MGGGDLNSKKSWHPNNMKNQERVWKAEQAAAVEQKRIMELQRERGQERDRAELNELAKRSAGTGNDGRLHWMYEKPDKSVQQEDYLLGKAIEKNDPLNKSEAEVIPAVARRVVGSSMLATAGDTQVDLARKIREDPLLLVKERERAARAALLNNPLQRRKLTELLRKEQEQKNERNSMKKSKKKAKDLDNVLAAKLNSLTKEKGIDLAALLASSDSSSSDSSPERKEKKSKKKKKKGKDKSKPKKSKKKKKTATHSSDSEDDDEYRQKINAATSGSSKKERRHSEKQKRRKTKYKDISESDDNKNKKDRKRHHTIDKDKFDIEPMAETLRVSDDRSRSKKRRRHSPEQRLKREEAGDKRDRSKKGLSEAERNARLAEMAAEGALRELERGRRVARQRADAPPAAQDYRAPQAPALPESLEARIHSNRHYIQRDRRHMDEPFARR